jgi:hypothetical protein
MSEALTWHTEQRKIRELVPFPQNPRKMTEAQVKALTASLKKFGLVEIPAIDTDNTLIAGHQRTNVMMLLGKGDETIDVRVPNRKLTEDEFKEYNVRSNQNRGQFDFDMLAGLFDEQQLLDMGFSERELDMVEFPELEGESMTEDVPNDTQYKYEVIFESDSDYDAFNAAVNAAHKTYKEATKSLSLLKHLRETT